jgi:hypothetical protein
MLSARVAAMSTTTSLEHNALLVVCEVVFVTFRSMSGSQFFFFFFFFFWIGTTYDKPVNGKFLDKSYRMFGH